MTTTKKQKHVIERQAPVEWRVPMNIPVPKDYHTILMDAPWTRNMAGSGKYGAALDHYNLMSFERIKGLPVDKLAAKDAHLYLWCMDSNVDQAIELMRHWGFRYINLIHWIKPRMGMGNYWREAAEVCVFGVRGKLPPKCRTQINWFIDYPTTHSTKPRMFISMLEKVSPGPYLEMFARERPASSNVWDCWGNEVRASDYRPAGADIYIPGYPVPKYSFDPTYDGNYPPETATDSTKDSTKDSDVSTDSTTADTGDGKEV